jgi:hypothetical protein
MTRESFAGEILGRERGERERGIFYFIFWCSRDLCWNLIN